MIPPDATGPNRHVESVEQISTGDMPRTVATSGSGNTVALHSVITTDELSRRASRPPDYESENRALIALADAIAAEPETVLQKLVDSALALCCAQSAGISLLEEDRKNFRWHAIAGAWASYVGGGTPRDFGPCGTVLDRKATMLFSHPERHFPYLAEATPLIEEALLSPFYVDGEALGTVWVIAHDPKREFDAEDHRVLDSLAKFAGVFYQLLRSRDALKADLAQRKEVEAALEASHRRTNEFLVVLAHELRNPLAPLRHALTVLQRTEGTGPTAARATGIMERQLGHMVRLVDDLLDVARIVRGGIELRTERIEVATVVSDAIESVRPICDDHEQRLVVTLPPQAIYLDADPTRVAQIVGNLLNNASKFTETGGRIELAVERADHEAVIRVRDTGIGMTADELRGVFEMFVQADRSLERSRGGLGVGLTLVRELAAKHGGTIEARSEGVGRGSEFVVRLPLVEAPLPNSVRADATTPTTSGAAAKKRVVLIEDNTDARSAFAALLELDGHDVIATGDGHRGIELILENHPQVAFVDLGLPELSGYEVARAVRSVDKNVLLIALTGYGQPEDRIRTHEAGFDTHLVKPIDENELIRVLATA